MSFTGIVASLMWDRASSWSFQAPQHFCFARLPVGYIPIFCAGSYRSDELQVEWHGVHSLGTWAGGKLQVVCMKIWVAYAGGQYGGCVKRSKHTLKMWSWEAKRVIFKTPLVSNTRRGQPQARLLQWSYWPVLNPCGGPVEAPHSLDLLSVTTANMRMAACFKKLLNWGVKIPAGMLCWVLHLLCATLSC